MIKKIHNARGIALLEVVFAIGIMTIVLGGLVALFQFFLSASTTNTEKIQAAYLLEEGAEVMRFLRDGDWSTINNLLANTDYYISVSGGLWVINTTATTTGNQFTRRIVLEDVYRKTADDTIVASTSPDVKAIDQNTKFFTVYATSPLSNEYRLSAYLANIFEL